MCKNRENEKMGIVSNFQDLGSFDFLTFRIGKCTVCSSALSEPKLRPRWSYGRHVSWNTAPRCSLGPTRLQADTCGGACNLLCSMESEWGSLADLHPQKMVEWTVIILPKIIFQACELVNSIDSTRMSLLISKNHQRSSSSFYCFACEVLGDVQENKWDFLGRCKYGWMIDVSDWTHFCLFWALSARKKELYILRHTPHPLHHGPHTISQVMWPLGWAVEANRATCQISEITMFAWNRPEIPWSHVIRTEL